MAHLICFLSHTMFSVPIYEVPVDRQVTVEYVKGGYVGQPDMIMLDDNVTLFTVYPMGHGKGEAHLSKSVDAGKTWSTGIKPNPTWS